MKTPTADFWWKLFMIAGVFWMSYSIYRIETTFAQIAQIVQVVRR